MVGETSVVVDDLGGCTMASRTTLSIGKKHLLQQLLSLNVGFYGPRGELNCLSTFDLGSDHLSHFERPTQKNNTGIEVAIRKRQIVCNTQRGGVDVIEE